MRVTSKGNNRDGIETLDRFNGKAEGTIAYYTALWVTLSEAGAPESLTTPLHDTAQHMVNALHPTKGYDIDEPQTQHTITKRLLGLVTGVDREDDKDETVEQVATAGVPESQSSSKFAWGPGDLTIINPPQQQNDSE